MDGHEPCKTTQSRHFLPCLCPRPRRFPPQTGLQEFPCQISAVIPAPPLSSQCKRLQRKGKTCYLEKIQMNLAPSASQELVYSSSTSSLFVIQVAVFSAPVPNCWDTFIPFSLHFQVRSTGVVARVMPRYSSEHIVVTHLIPTYFHCP